MKISPFYSSRLSTPRHVSRDIRKIASTLARVFTTPAIAAALLTVAFAGSSSAAFGQFGSGANYFAGSQSVFLDELGSRSPLKLNQGVALDGKGNIYMADALTNTVLVRSVILGSSAQVSISTGSTDIGQITVDKNGTVYIADIANGQLLKEVLSGGVYTQSIILSGIGVGGVAVDASLSVYVGDSASKTVWKLTPSGRTYVKSAVATKIADPSGLAVDASGNVYVADDSEGLVLEETKSGSSYTQSTVAYDLKNPRGVVVDANGDVFVSDDDPNYSAIQEYYNAGNYYSEYYVSTDGLYFPGQLAIDPTGIIYLADSGNGRVLILSGTGGAFAPTAVGSTSQTIDIFFTSSVGVDLGNSAVVTQGASGLDFADADPANNTCNAGAALNVSLTCMVRVSMTPRLTGLRNGAVILNDTSSNPIAFGYLSGVGTGSQVAFLPPAQTTVPYSASGQTSPYGIAVDASGNVYIVDSQNNRVLKETFTGGGFTETVIVSGLSSPTGVAVDGAGIVYVTDTGDSIVFALVPYGASYEGSELIYNLTSPYGIAVDGFGNVFITDPVAKVVSEVQTDSYSVLTSLPTSGLHGPFAIAADSSGNVYFTDNGNILKMTRSGATYTQSTFDTGFASPYGLAVDGGGNVYVSEFNNHDVIEDKLTGSSFTRTTFPASGLSAPYGVAVDGGGNVYIADVGNNQVYKEGVSNAPALTFAATNVGSTSADSPQVVEVENIGNSNLSFSIPSMGTNPSVAANFSLFSGGADPCPMLTPGSATPGILAAGAECSLSISFQPTASGSLQGSLVLADNSLNTASTQSIALSGTGLRAAASLSATSLSFGSETVGTTSVSQSLTLSNTGTLPLALTSIAITGADASSFVFANSCGASLSVGASCSIHGHFTPATFGALTAAITITDNAPGSPQKVALSGEGLGSTASLLTTSLSFGSQALNTAGASQSVTLTNLGNEPLAITSISLTGAGAPSFVFANSCGTSVAVGANCSIHGHFAPATVGSLVATIVITDNATGSPQAISLSGTGQGPKASLSATSLSFGTETVEASSTSQSVTLTNTGNEPLSITTIGLTGTDASSFVFSNDCGTSLAVGANCAIHGHFSPMATGILTAAITLVDSAVGSPQSITLSGTGLGPVASLSATILSFGSQAVGTAGGSQTVTLTNTGTAALSIASISVTGANASSFDFANSCGTSLAAGANCTIHGHFSPTKVGALTATVAITDNANGSPQTITLSGTGQ